MTRAGPGGVVLFIDSASLATPTQPLALITPLPAAPVHNDAMYQLEQHQK